MSSLSRARYGLLQKKDTNSVRSSVPHGSVENLAYEKVRQCGRCKLSVPEIIACSSPKSNSWLPSSHAYCVISVVLLCLDQDIEFCLYIYLRIKSLQSFYLGSAQQPIVRGHQDYIIASWL